MTYPTRNLLATIPFPSATFSYAQRLAGLLVADDIVVETRGDWVQIVQAPKGDFPDNNWYVIVHTGNLLGMIGDLKAGGYL